MQLINILNTTLLVTAMLSSTVHVLGDAVSDLIDDQVAATQKAHNLASWWEKDVVSADIEIIFGGDVVVDGRFFFEAHGPRARFDRADGATIVFDGESAWLSPPDASPANGRFHVLTWPWFVVAPFKMKGEGTYLDQLEKVSSEGKLYTSLRQTFDTGVGDTPDDWYRFFINPDTQEIEAMSYIVTYGRELEEAKKKPSIIKYYDYKDEGGPVISRRYEFWFWDSESKSTIGDRPKATGTVKAVSYPLRADVDFSIPEDALELTL